MTERIVKATLRRSAIGTSPRQRATLRGLGLKRVGITGEMLIIESMKATGESCAIRDGNPFASQ